MRKKSLKKLDIWIREVTATAINKAHYLDQSANILCFKKSCISLEGEGNKTITKRHNIDSSFRSLIRRD